MIRNVAFIVIGLVVAAGVAWGIINWLPAVLKPAGGDKPAAPAESTVSTIRVLAANNPIPKGRQISAQDLIFMDFPAQKDANGQPIVPGWISVDKANVTDEESRKQSLSGQYAQFDVMPFTPLTGQQFGPNKPPEPELIVQKADVDTSGPLVVQTGPDDTKPVDCILCKEDVVDFPLVEAGTLSSAGSTLVDVVLIRKADLVSGGDWTVSEPILRNIKLERLEGDEAGPSGVTFYAKLKDKDEVTKVKLARAIGTVRLEPANPSFRPRASQICIADRCYQPEAAPEQKELIPGQPLDGFVPNNVPGLGPDGMPNMQVGGAPNDQQLQGLTPGGAVPPPGTPAGQPSFNGAPGATFQPGQPSQFNNQRPSFNSNGLNGQGAL